MDSLYCINCGNNIDNKDKFCTGCGINIEDNLKNRNENKNDSGPKIASIILGSISILFALMFIFAPFGLILSIIGLILGLCALRNGNNIIGILLSSIGLILSLIVTIIMVLIFIFVVDAGYLGDSFDNIDRGYYYNDYGLEDF